MTTITAIARRIALLNYKINHYNLNSVTYSAPYDKQQIVNERGRLMMQITMDFPEVDGEEIVTKIAPNEKREVDIFIILEQMRTIKRKAI
jgi:hypothetical protein